MKRILSLIPLFIVAVAFAGPSAATKKAYDRLAKLAGTWEGKGKTMDLKVVYRLTGAGSALMETQFPDSSYEMVTMYHLDGDNLVLTHYCASGNQPMMKFVPGKDPNVLQFNFYKGSNMKPSDSHMHSVKIRFISDDEIQSDWTSYNAGKPSGTAVFHLKRVK